MDGKHEKFAIILLVEKAAQGSEWDTWVPDGSISNLDLREDVKSLLGIG